MVSPLRWSIRREQRETNDAVEREGVARAMRARDAADLMLIVIDSGEQLTDEDRRLLECVIIERATCCCQQG